MGNEILNRFTDKGWEEIDRAYCMGEIGSLVAYTQVASLFTGSRAQMLEFVSSRERIDPHFLEFYRFCLKQWSRSQDRIRRPRFLYRRDTEKEQSSGY